MRVVEPNVAQWNKILLNKTCKQIRGCPSSVLSQTRCVLSSRFSETKRKHFGIELHLRGQEPGMLLCLVFF